MNVVLLSNSKERVDAIRAASKRKGFGCRVVPDEEQASAAIHEAGEGILIVDAQATPRIDEVLRRRLPGWPVLVLVPRFDSVAWVEMFKAGASEVIGDPLIPRKVDAAFDGFLRGPGAVTPMRTMWRALARRFGFGTGPE